MTAIITFFTLIKIVSVSVSDGVSTICGFVPKSKEVTVSCTGTMEAEPTKMSWNR